MENYEENELEALLEYRHCHPKSEEIEKLFPSPQMSLFGGTQLTL